MQPKLLRLSLWLINFRWIAVLCIIVIIVVTEYILIIDLHEIQLFVLVVILALLNLFSLLSAQNTIQSKKIHKVEKRLKWILNFQISTDFIILTMILHFSGGIDNPFIVYFIFHMIIASITLTKIESYLQTSFALILVGLLSFLEYYQVVPHYKLEGFINSDNYSNLNYLIGTGLIFVSTSYLIVYMTNTIVERQKQNQIALRKANKELLNKDKLKNEYVIQITHSIKSYLAVIVSSLGVVDKKMIKEEKRDEFIHRAYKRVSSLSSFVKQLLHVTKIKLNYVFKIESFSIRKSIIDIITKHQVIAEEKSLTLTHNIDETIDIINGNQFTIEEVITNLISNSIKYTAKGGKIELSAKDHGKYTLIEISDTGIGIPEKDQANIFDEFYRALNARNKQFEGSGLGLSIVKQIINSHGGKIWMESEENKGSKFSFTIPKISIQT